VEQGQRKMVIYNPKIAELHYKDQRINVKIPIRVAKIVMTELRCKKCGMSASKTKLNKYVRDGGLCKIWPAKNGSVCPICYERSSIIKDNRLTENRLEEEHLVRYKLYANVGYKFIDIKKLLVHFVPTESRWHSNETSQFSHLKIGCYTIFNSLDYILGPNFQLAKYHSPPKGQTVSLKMFPLDEKAIEAAYEDAKARRLVKKL
jgi:hypothetical protein